MFQACCMLRLPTIRDRFAEIAASSNATTAPVDAPYGASALRVCVGQNDPGTGKSHLLPPLGTLAAKAGYRARYTLATTGRLGRGRAR
jgi:hypothetical protein